MRKQKWWNPIGHKTYGTVKVKLKILNQTFQNEKDERREERKYGARRENKKNFPKNLHFNLSLKCFRLRHTHARTHAHCHWQFSPKTSEFAAAAAAAAAVAYLLLVFNPFHKVFRLHV